MGLKDFRIGYLMPTPVAVLMSIDLIISVTPAIASFAASSGIVD
jgi:hypothetical protein